MTGVVVTSVSGVDRKRNLSDFTTTWSFRHKEIAATIGILKRVFNYLFDNNVWFGINNT